MVVNYKPINVGRFLHIFVVRCIFTAQPPEAMRIYNRLTVYVNMFVINAVRLAMNWLERSLEKYRKPNITNKLT